MLFQLCSGLKAARCNNMFNSIKKPIDLKANTIVRYFDEQFSNSLFTVFMIITRVMLLYVLLVHFKSSLECENVTTMSRLPISPSLPLPFLSLGYSRDPLRGGYLQSGVT